MSFQSTDHNIIYEIHFGQKIWILYIYIFSVWFSQIEAMEVAAGVTVKEGGRVKKGPNRVRTKKIICIYDKSYMFYFQSMVYLE